MNEYDELLQNENEYDTEIAKDTDVQKLRASTIQAVQSNPDVVAQARKLSTKTGIPLSVVERNFDEVERKEKLNEYDALIDSSPRLAERMKNAEFAKLSHDDTQALSDLEARIKEHGEFKAPKQPEPSIVSWLSGLKESFIQGSRRTRIGLKMQLPDVLPEPDPIKAQVLRADTVRKYLQSQSIEELATPEFESSTARGIYSGTSSFVRTIPGLAASIATRTPVPMLGLMGVETEAEAYGKYIARGASPSEAFVGAVGEGATEVVTELLPMGFLIKNLGRTGAGQFLTGLLAREVPGEQIATVVQDAIDTAIANPDKTWGQYALERPEAAYQTLVATLTQTAIMGGINVAAKPFTKQDAQIQSAQQNLSLLDRINTLAQNSKLRARDPESFAKYIEGLTKDTPAENVMIPVEQWNTYWQSANLDPRVMAQGIAGELAYDEAIHTGGDLVIPMSRYATQLAHTEHGKALLPDIRLKAEELTQREAEALSKEMEKAAETVAKPEDDSILQDITEQMVAAGQERTSAESYAVLHDAFFKTIASKSGTEASKLYKQYGLKVERKDLSSLSKERSVSLNSLADEGNNQAIVAQSLVDRLGLSAQHLSDVFESISLAAKPDGLVSAPSFSAVLTQMRRAILDDTKVLDAIVGSVTVDMVNDLFGSQAAAKVALHNEAMSENSLAFNAELPISGSGDAANPVGLLVREAAIQAAKLANIALGSGRKSSETTSTLFANQSNRSGQKDSPRASIAIGRNATSTQTIISLFNKADLSSFLHESGHFFLEVFGDVYDTIKTIESDKLTPEQKLVIDDYEAALKWIGAESKDKIGAEQHEKWARGFEAYLMEGKAPSPELRTVFAKFRAWLVALYRSIQKLDVQLNDDIRGVMDRLLATEEQIENAEREAEIIAIFTDAKDAGMTDVEFDAYRKTVEQASQKAKEQLQQKFMAEIRREQETWWKDERGKVREEVLTEVNQQPSYIAEAVLKTGKLPDGSELPEGTLPVKLDYQSIADAHGKDFFKRLPKGTVVKTGGVNPSIAADVLGFPSGESLLMELASLRPKNALIEAETDKRMEERYGSMLLDGTVAEEAQAAVLGEGRAKVIEAEIKALRKRSREVKPFVKAEQKKQQSERREGLAILSAPMTSQSVMKQMADGVIAQKRVRDLHPSSYLMAIRRSAKQAVKLAGKGDYQGAMMEKQRELLNLELYRAANDAVDGIEKAKKYLGKFDKKSTRDKMRGEAIEQIDELLARFDLRHRSLKSIDAEKQTLAKFVESESERLAAVVPALPEFVLNESYRKNFKDMTVEEMHGLVDSVKQLERLARREQEQYLAIRQMNFEQERKSVLDRIRKFHPQAFDDEGNPKALEPDFVPSISKAAKTLGDKFAGEFLNAETILNLLEGGEMGDVTRSLFGRMSERSNWKAERLAGIYKKLKPLFKQYSLIEKQQFGRKDIGTEIGLPLTRENAVVVALLYGNKEGRERLMNYGWSDFRIQEIVGLLDAKDMKLVDGIWKLFDEDLWPELKDLNERTRGTAPPKVEALSYPTRYGPSRGGYFRLRYDTDLDERAHRFDESQAVKDMLGGSMGMTAKTAQGTSEQRREGVKMRPRLDLGVFSETVNETVHDLAYREAVADTIRMLNDSDMTRVIKSAAGVPAYRALVTRVREVAAPPRNPSGFIEKTLSVARKNTIVTLLSGARTALLNITGVSTSFSRINGGLLLREIAKFVSPRMGEMFRFATERSSYMRQRFNNYDRDLQDMTEKLTVKGRILPSTASWLWLMGMTDRMVSIPTWNAAFAEGMQKYQNDDTQAVEYADHIVRQTQGSGREVDLPKIMSGHGGYGQLKRVFTMFQSYFNAQLNQLVRAGAVSAQEAKENRAVAVAKFTGRFMAIVVIPAVLSTIGGRDDDDLDELDDNWFKKFAFAVTMYGAAMVPIVRDIAAFTWAQFDKSVANYGFKISPVQSAGEGVAKALVSARDLAVGDADEKDIKNLIMGASYTVGLPGKQISDTVLGTVSFLEGDSPTAVIFGPDK